MITITEKLDSSKTFKLTAKGKEALNRLIEESGKKDTEFITDIIHEKSMKKLTGNPTISYDLRKHFASDVAKLKEATGSINEIFISQMSAIVVEKNRWEKSYTEMATKKDEEIKFQKDKISELEEIKKELEIKCSELTANYDLARESAEACKKRAEDQEVWLKNSQEEISGLKQDLTQANKLRDDLKNVEVKNKHLEEDLKKMASENESLKITFKNEIDSLMSKHKSETDVQVKKYNEDIAALESKHMNEIHALQKQHEENLKLKIKEVEIKCKEAALEDQQKLRDKFNDESREREKEIRKDLLEEIEKMQNFYQEKFEDKLAKLGIKANAESAIDTPEHPTKKARRPRKKLEEETK